MTGNRKPGELSKETLHYEMLISLRRIIRATDLHSKKLVKFYGLTGPQLILIEVIAREGEISIGKLARHVSLSQATVTNIVERLEQKEIVIRRKEEQDKRRVDVSLTDTARDILERKPSLLDEKFIKKFEKLEVWEKTQILSTLQRLAEMMTPEETDIDHAAFILPREAMDLKEAL